MSCLSLWHTKVVSIINSNCSICDFIDHIFVQLSYYAGCSVAALTYIIGVSVFATIIIYTIVLLILVIMVFCQTRKNSKK